MVQMRKATSTITVPHLFSPISAFSAESKSHIIALRFNVHGTFQINQSNFLISKITSILLTILLLLQDLIKAISYHQEFFKETHTNRRNTWR